MKNLNKKGFFMTEALMVIVFVTLIFTFLYVSVIPLIGNYNDKIVRESDIDIVYKLYSVRKAINEDTNKNILMNGEYNSITCNSFSNTTYCNQLMNILELNNYSLIYTDSINDLYNSINNGTYNVDNEVKEYLENYKDTDENAIILLDKNKHTISHLEYIDPDMPLGDYLKYKLKRFKKCNPIYTDSDGVMFFSGLNTCVNMNYVWYSGKLWRITAIYPDGSFKMVTDNNITSIYYNEENNPYFYKVDEEGEKKSYMYRWLNEEFIDTLYNHENIIDTTKKWNANLTTSISTKPNDNNLISANVGLINSYEYYVSSLNGGNRSSCNGTIYTNGYLYISYNMWLLNQASSTTVWYLTSGACPNKNVAGGEGVRPAIYVKNDVKFSGKGTEANPFRLYGDKSSGQVNDLVNTRLSGEYVKLKSGTNAQLFRIIGVEDDKTKILSINYAAGGDNKLISTSAWNGRWGSGNTLSDGTWYRYLNDIYYPDMVNTYGEIFDKGRYYLGFTSGNYLLSICSNTTSGNTKVCNKATSGLFSVGLPYYGDMHATQQKGVAKNSFFLINGINHSSQIWPWRVYNNGLAASNNRSSYAARPTLHLKSTVKIKSGKGTKDNPYVVGL